MQYPIGKLQLPSPEAATSNRQTHLKQLTEFPAQFATAAREITNRNLLNQTYRPGGWTARQVIHHVADSHTNAYVRHKRILTEEHPTLTPYDETRWAELADVQRVPIEVSLSLLAGLHERLVSVLGNLTEADWGRTAHHGGAGVDYTLDQLAAHYAWHGRHHLGHLRVILERGES